MMNRMKTVIGKEEETENTKPKKGGRPKGSKNKPKVVPADEKPKEVKGGEKVRTPIVLWNGKENGIVRVQDWDSRKKKRVETIYSSRTKYEKSREKKVVESKDGTVCVHRWDSRLNVRIMTNYNSYAEYEKSTLP